MGAKASCCDSGESIAVEHASVSEPEQALKGIEQDQAEEEARRKREQEEEQEKKRKQEEELRRREQEEQKKKEEAEKRAEQERLEAEEARRRGDEEEARKHQLAAERAERELREREEAERSARNQKVQEWLKQHKYNEVTALKKAKCCGVSNSPLHTAADAGDVEIVQGLLEAKADPEAKNSSGKTALQLAELKNHSNVVVMLKEYPRSPEQK